jgi:hypothetical protein
MSHTPEPWIYDLPDAGHEGIICGKHGGEVVDGEFSEANARRIVACVNYCTNARIEELEGGSLEGLKNSLNASIDYANGQIATLRAALQTQAEEAAKLMAQRDELLAALIEMEREKSDYMLRNNLGDPAREHTNKMARAAITNATT